MYLRMDRKKINDSRARSLTLFSMKTREKKSSMDIWRMQKSTVLLCVRIVVKYRLCLHCQLMVLFRLMRSQSVVQKSGIDISEKTCL